MGVGFSTTVSTSYKCLASGNPATTHRTIVGQQALAGGLERRDRTQLCFGDGHQSLGAALVCATDIQMIADKVQKRILAGERPGAMDGMSMAQGFSLVNKMQTTSMVAGNLDIGPFVARADHNPDLVNARGQHLLDQDGQHRFLRTVPIDQRLERQSPLPAPGCCNHRLGNLHTRLALD